MKKNGFTLVEIMITVAIMAVLVAISASIYSGVQKSNRDQARVRDLQTIKQALEMYRSDKGVYPTDAENELTLNEKYLTTWPADPVANQSYIYQPIPSGFIICAKKEGNMADFPPCGAGNIGLQSD